MTIFQTIAKELPCFTTVDDKERFLFVVGALSVRLISLRKASEMMHTDEKSLLSLLDAIDVPFLFLETGDVETEAKW